MVRTQEDRIPRPTRTGGGGADSQLLRPVVRITTAMIGYSKAIAGKNEFSG